MFFFGLGSTVYGYFIKQSSHFSTHTAKVLNHTAQSFVYCFMKIDMERNETKLINFSHYSIDIVGPSRESWFRQYGVWVRYRNDCVQFHTHSYLLHKNN